MMSHTWYEVEVSGELWQGGKGSTTYTFPVEPTKDEIKGKSGDFQRITRACVYRLTESSERIVNYKY